MQCGLPASSAPAKGDQPLRTARANAAGAAQGAETRDHYQDRHALRSRLSSLCSSHPQEASFPDLKSGPFVGEPLSSLSYLPFHIHAF